MKRFILVPALLLLLLLPARAALAGDGVRWVGTLETAVKEAKDRGSLIFIAEVIDQEADNDAQKEAFKDPAFVKASRDYVCVYACPMMQHGQIDVTVDGKTVRRCKDAPDIVCEDHMKAWNEIRKDYADLNTASNGEMRIPFQFIIDSNGKHIVSVVNGTVEGGFGAIPGPAMAEILKQIAAQMGKGLSSDDYEKLKGKLAEAGEAEKAGDGKKALKLCAEIVKANERTTLADEAKKIQERIAAGGRAEFEKALALVEKDPIGAVSAMEDLADAYAGTELEKEAKAKVAELKKDPRVKSALTQLAARKEAEKQIAKAEDLIGREEYAKALGVLDDVAEKFAGTSVGEKAKARAEALRGDEKIMKAAREQEAEKFCKGWLSMGKSYAKNGMKDQAREQFQKIIDKFPGTSYAEEAALELEKLK